MGIDYDSRLIFGWTVSQEKLYDWVNSAIDEWVPEQDLIETIEREFKLPKNWKIIETSPYFDSSQEDKQYHLTLDFKDEEITLFKLTEMYNLDSFTEGMKLAKQLGCDGEATIYSVPHIW